MTYHLGVDLGTTYSAAAVHRVGEPAPEVVTLGASNPVMPSVVLLRADGTVLHGEAAERRAVDEPTRVGRAFKRRLGDSTPLVLGGVPYGADALMARLLRAIVDLVTEREGEPPASVTLTHPASYGPYKLDQMREVGRNAGVPVDRLVLLPEPEAAALSYAARDRVLPGDVVAVYDFGGGTFDAALVQRVDDGFVLIGRPDGLDRFGGIDVDEAVLAFVDDALGDRLSAFDADAPDVQAGVAALRDQCRIAKETLSSDTDTTIAVSLPGLQTRVRLTRPELESMLRPRLMETIDALERTVASAGLRMDQVSRILLVGGSSRIPLVGELLRDRTHRPLAVDAHPKFAIALGAALAGSARAAGAVPPTPPPARPVTLPAPAGAVPPPPPPPPPPPTPAPGPASAMPPTAQVPFVPPTSVSSGSRRRGPLLAGVAALVLIAAVVIGVIATRGDDASDAGATATTLAPTTPASEVPATGAPASEAPVVTDAAVPVATEAGPATTLVAVPAARELDEVADWAGFRFTFTRVSVEQPLELDTATNVVVDFRLLNYGVFDLGFPTFLLRLDGIDTPGSTSTFSARPGSTAEGEVTFRVDLDQLDRLPAGLVVIGDVVTDQAVAPLGPEADPAAVVRHAPATVQLDLDVAFGPGDRYLDGEMTVASSTIGASSVLDQPADAGKVWLSIDYDACVRELDSFLTPMLQLPDGTLVKPEGVGFGNGTVGTGLALAPTCPARARSIALWEVDPALVSGQTLTVLLDDSEDEQLPGSFTFTAPVVPPPDQVPA